MASETLNSHFKPSPSPPNSSKLLSASCPPPPPHPESMFTSLPTTAKSSKWLQRLRSSRGFPESDHIDLEHFLSTSREKTDPTDPVLTSKIPLPEDNHRVAEESDDSGAVQERDLINNVLSELFCMGDFEDRSRIKRKKSCRKQQCPRICVVSTDLDVQNVAPPRIDRFSSPSPLPLTLSSRRKVTKVKEVSQVTERVGEEEKAHWDVSAYSQTEVTVIDTSVPCWKFEKVLYRSKNVWKVGDKKGKGLMSGDRKKRKERLNENGGNVQKKKKLKKKLELCNSSKYVDKEESMAPPKFNQGHDQGKMVAANEKKRDNCSQVQEKSFSKKQIDEGSSVILIKSIPTTVKKNVSGFSNISVKSIQR
ncbi:hypothetical protein SSX86_016994 [Deinandra increscens subsp. villosa]|uniref:Uncharacterized protein n=1 Tax=Deinandra increscens subsp. villosa TaxID=3103831 RepID=A0AAP0CUF1_9ASTR